MTPIKPNRSIDFFERQFQQQASLGDVALNPFESAALPHLRGRVLDLGCGMGGLSLAAARQGCSVVALDASAAAIDHLQRLAAAERLRIEAARVDLSDYEIGEDFDAIVSIGLLMFFDCPAAFRMLGAIQSHVRPGGVAVVNVLVEGTTYMDMFDAGSHCLFARDELATQFHDWDIVESGLRDFEAPGGRIKAFATVIARKPQ